MELVGFNGFGYSIDRFLGRGREEWRWNWNERKARLWADKLRGDAVVVGFSDGATAASHLPSLSDHVRDVVLHSPMFDRPLVNPLARYWIYCTHGDRTPSAKGSLRLYHWIADRGGEVRFCWLDMRTFYKPTMMERFVLTPLRHVFHNLDLGEHPATRKFFWGVG